MKSQALQRQLRRVIPSLSKITYQTPYKQLLDLSDLPAAGLFPEFRDLPPNRLRVRIGNGKRIVANQVQHIDRSRQFWLANFAEYLSIAPDTGTPNLP